MILGGDSETTLQSSWNIAHLDIVYSFSRYYQHLMHAKENKKGILSNERTNDHPKIKISGISHVTWSRSYCRVNCQLPDCKASRNNRARRWSQLNERIGNCLNYTSASDSVLLVQSSSKLELRGLLNKTQRKTYSSTEPLQSSSLKKHNMNYGKKHLQGGGFLG